MEKERFVGYRFIVPESGRVTVPETNFMATPGTVILLGSYRALTPTGDYWFDDLAIEPESSGLIGPEATRD